VEWGVLQRASDQLKSLTYRGPLMNDPATEDQALFGSSGIGFHNGG